MELVCSAVRPQLGCRYLAEADLRDYHVGSWYQGPPFGKIGMPRDYVSPSN